MPANTTPMQHTRQLAEIDPALGEAFQSQGMALLDDIGPFELSHWADLVVEIAHRSPVLALAFVNASRQVLPELTRDQREYWATMGLRISAGGWKSVQLACRMFESSHHLLQLASTENLDKLVDILCDVSNDSAELATSCLQAAPAIFRTLPADNHEPFLKLAAAVAHRSRADIWLYFERAPELLNAFKLPGSNDFVALAARIISQAQSRPYTVLLELSGAISLIDEPEHPLLYDLAQKIASVDGYAAVAFLKSVPRLRELLSLDALVNWVNEGLALSSHVASTEVSRNLRAFYSMESKAADELLVRLSGRVEFERTGNLLQLFGEALGGAGLHVQPVEALTERKIGWRSPKDATTDGHNIFVPAFIDSFDSWHDNFDAYRVSIAHQCGRLQFNSFGYQFGANGACLAASHHRREGILRTHAVVAIQRFFDLFADRALISTLFSIVEDSRIEAKVALEYQGLGAALERVRVSEVSRRPPPDELHLRQALLENLVRMSLGALSTLLWPEPLIPPLAIALGVLQIVRRPDATVQDSAEISAWLYDFASMVPELPPGDSPWPWRTPTVEAIPRYDELPEVPALPATFTTATAGNFGESSATVAMPDFHGAFKPELVQTLDTLAQQPDLDQLDIENLLANSVEIDSETMNTDQFIERLQAGSQDEDTTTWETGNATDDYADYDEVIRWCRYDEWDFRANDYLQGWCHLGERRIHEGNRDYYEDTLDRHHRLVLDIRRQFEMMRPESHRKIKNLDDGHEIDLEQAIAFVVDKKAGAGATARFYSRRDKVERSVATAFLLDMSWSTEDSVRAENGAELRRIIDVERDATVLIIEALEAIGDAYGIFGFSGYGRHNVSFHTIKELDEPFDLAIKRRVDGISPMRSTRMGAAIRHTHAKLALYPARVKLLILISDGRPQDQGYGQGRDDVQYGVHDTKQALMEVKRSGMVPFVITVDREGPDYLGELCGDIGYEIVDDVESLPRRLPAIYRYLAS